MNDAETVQYKRILQDLNIQIMERIKELKKEYQKLDIESNKQKIDKKKKKK